MSLEIAERYGNRVRIRVCGLCWNGNALLMVKHNLDESNFWAPPGGGLEFGESMEEALKREFLEETGLNVTPGKFLFGCEFIQKPLHAIELFFEVERRSGKLTNGNDPEIPIIEEVQFLSPDEIQSIPRQHRHGIFNKFENATILRELSGFYKI
jgi:8-oxo-dGTP diphosphatase